MRLQAKIMDIDNKTQEVLANVTHLEGVGRMISKRNLKTLCDAHVILGDLIKAAQQLESSKILFDGERFLFTGGD